MMNKATPLTFAALAALTLGLGACHRAPADLSTAPIANAHIGGAFSLVDQDGHRVTDKSYAGKFRMIYFGYTFCPDACPTDLQLLMAGYRKFEHDDPQDAAKLQPIFITVDPERDTPAKMKAYVNAFHPHLVGLTGTVAEIEAVTSPNAYAAVHQKLPPGPNGQYLIDHGRYALLFGPNGEPIMILNTQGTAAQITTELETWVR